jgi:molybdopterin-biosynthesis enzyme MoeA-like protein
VNRVKSAIVNALNALQHRCTYVFTTGGIEPTQGDITGDCVSKTFGVLIDTAPRAPAIWVKTTGAEMSRGASAHDAHPQGADLILDKVSRAPGFWNNCRSTSIPSSRLTTRLPSHSSGQEKGPPAAVQKSPYHSILIPGTRR